jgi:hypothetical protein
MKTKTKKAEIHFDAETLLARVESFATGREPTRETKRAPARAGKSIR